MEEKTEEIVDSFIAQRCATALLQSKEYEELKNRAHDSEEEFDAALRASYIKGATDVIKTLCKYGLIL